VAAPSDRPRVARSVVTAALAVVLAACGVPADAPAAGAREEVARNIILILGSGLGQAQHDFLRLALAGPTGQLAMDRLAVTGSMTPVDPVTDTAAGATTLSTGMPTVPGAIGVDADGERLTTVLEHARDAGKATGLVTTAEVTDPTLAAFAAHVAPRPPAKDPEDEQEGTVERTIARQYLEESEVDVILGGGAARWSPLVEPARTMGYTTVSDPAARRAA
jgi:alkaline phosphatase